MQLWYSERHTKQVEFSIKVDRQLYSGQSEFQRIDVFDSKEFGRFLTLDGYMMLTEKDEFIYHEMMVHVPLAIRPDTKSVLVIGAGDVAEVAEALRSAPRWSLHPALPPPRPIAWDVPGGKLSTYRVGGIALGSCTDVTVEELPALMAWCRETGMPWRVIGGCSNLLVNAAGYPGIFIRLSNAGCAESEFGTLLTVSAGMTGGKLMSTCQERGLGGLEFMEGIPGTVGGWVAGNAGAHGKAIGDVVTAVELMTPEGHRHTLHDNFGFAYRRFGALGNAIVVSATFSVTPCYPDDVRRERHAFHRKRIDFSGLRTAGSVFKNPEDGHAGQLLDEAGCKSLRVGGARVWESHANVIIADGGCTPSDIQALITLMLRRVPHLELELNIL